jgi:Holliday junction resolvasome RuvABC endonuclease subunit
MRHLLLYRFVPGAYPLKRQPSGISSRPISRVGPARPKGLRPRESPIAPGICPTHTHTCLCPYNDGNRQDSVLMTASKEPTVLLALDAGVRETGWAVFKGDEVIESGVTGLSTRRKVEPEVRVSHLLQSLDELTEKWNPKLVALCQPSGINCPVPALDLLLTSLAEWSAGRDLPQFSYTAQEVRTTIAGHPNASRDQLGYATMLLLGLIGQGRSTHEWEAIAVGHYHLTRGKQAEAA